MIEILPPARAGDRDPARAPEPDRISLPDMDTLVQAGEALPVFPEFDVGPTWYGGAWWVVPHGELERGYAVASDDDHLQLTTALLLLQRSAEVVADIQQTERNPETQRDHADDPWPPRPTQRRRWWRK